MRSSRRRPLLGLALALAAGLAAAYLDRQASFDDTAVLVTLITGGAAAATLLARAGCGWLLAVVAAAGLPVPIAELATNGDLVSLAAPGFALAGATLGVAVSQAFKAAESPGRRR